MNNAHRHFIYILEKEKKKGSGDRKSLNIFDLQFQMQVKFLARFEIRH